MIVENKQYFNKALLDDLQKKVVEGKHVTVDNSVFLDAIVYGLDSDRSLLTDNYAIVFSDAVIRQNHTDEYFIIAINNRFAILAIVYRNFENSVEIKEISTFDSRDEAVKRMVQVDTEGKKS
jgi:hypothetical protein